MSTPRVGLEDHWLLARLAEFAAEPAVIWRGTTCRYGRLLEAIERWGEQLRRYGIAPGESIALVGDYSPEATALLLALVVNRNVAVPLAAAVAGKTEGCMDVARVSAGFELGSDGSHRYFRRARQKPHPLLANLREKGEAGLVLFSSGSTGESKASLLFFDRLLDKFKRRGRPYRTLAFLLSDHIGGINTLLSVLASGGTMVAAEERSVQAICATIERYRVQLLPTTPTFLKMVLISGAYREHDLSSLEFVTYGTEPQSASTLEALTAAFPWVRFKQTYGLSELGILPTRSRDSASLWLRVGGEGFATRVVDGILWIRADSAMLGYLNAPSPFDAEGWFNTQDAVEVDGEYIRILGRTSEIINVAGEKVYPAEVESVLLQMANVRDATVTGKRSPVTGGVVVATLTLNEPEEPRALERRVREFCKSRLASYQVPVLVQIADGTQVSERFKKMRPGMAAPLVKAGAKP